MKNLANSYSMTWRQSARSSLSAMFNDSHLPAIFQNWTTRAARELSGADVFTKGNHQFVDLQPVSAGGGWFPLRDPLFGRGCGPQYPPTGGAVERGFERETPRGFGRAD